MAFLQLDQQFLPASWSPLHISSYQNDVRTLQNLLLSCADHDRSQVDVEDAHKRTPLNIALQNGRKEAAALLVNHGASLEKALEALDLVTRDVLFECGSYLLRQVSTQQHLKSFPAFLTAVACSSSMEGDEELLRAAVSVSQQAAKRRDNLGFSPLHYAVLGVHLDCMRLLLCNGANPMAVSPLNQNTPLHMACRKGYVHAVALLLEASSDPGQALSKQTRSGSTPLHFALLYGHWEIVLHILTSYKSLLDDQNLLDSNGYSIAGLLSQLRCQAGVIPVSYQLQIPCLCPDEATRLLHCSISDNVPELVEYAIDQGADVESHDHMQNTPLLLASRMGLESISRILVQRGANIRTSDVSGKNALHYAAREGHNGVVSVLLDVLGLGSSIGSTDGHFSEETAKVDHSVIAATLFGLSADGYTPLELAVLHRQRACIELLLGAIRTWQGEAESGIQGWKKLLTLAVTWANSDLLCQLESFFPSSWAEELATEQPLIAPRPQPPHRHRIRRAKWKKPFTTTRISSDLRCYPLHNAITAGNVDAVQFFLCRSPELQSLLLRKDSHGRSAAFLLGNFISSAAVSLHGPKLPPNLDQMLLDAMSEESSLPEQMSFEWSVLHLILTGN